MPCCLNLAALRTVSCVLVSIALSGKLCSRNWLIVGQVLMGAQCSAKFRTGDGWHMYIYSLSRATCATALSCKCNWSSSPSSHSQVCSR